MPHTCHAHQCEKVTSPRIPFCAPHLIQLPPKIKSGLAKYEDEPGKNNPSDEYMIVLLTAMKYFQELAGINTFAISESLNYYIQSWRSKRA